MSFVCYFVFLCLFVCFCFFTDINIHLVLYIARNQFELTSFTTSDCTGTYLAYSMRTLLKNCLNLHTLYLNLDQGSSWTPKHFDDVFSTDNNLVNLFVYGSTKITIKIAREIIEYLYSDLENVFFAIRGVKQEAVLEHLRKCREHEIVVDKICVM
jgi:hypothetical protein